MPKYDADFLKCAICQEPDITKIISESDCGGEVRHAHGFLVSRMRKRGKKKGTASLYVCKIWRSLRKEWTVWRGNKEQAEYNVGTCMCPPLLSCRGVLAMHFQRNLNAVLCSPVLFYIHIWENLQHTYTQHTQIYNTELKCRLLLRQPPLQPHQRGPKLQKIIWKIWKSALQS